MRAEPKLEKGQEAEMGESRKRRGRGGGGYREVEGIEAVEDSVLNRLGLNGG